MTNLINKLLAIFQLKLVSTKPVNLVEESVKFLNTTKYSGGLCGAHDVDITKEIPHDYYFGDINYMVDKDGKSYIRQQVLGMDDKYYDYDGDTYTLEEIQEKQTIRCGKNGNENPN